MPRRWSNEQTKASGPTITLFTNKRRRREILLSMILVFVGPARRYTHCCSFILPRLERQQIGRGRYAGLTGMIKQTAPIQDCTVSGKKRTRGHRIITAMTVHNEDADDAIANQQVAATSSRRAFQATTAQEASCLTDGADLGNGVVMPWIGFGTYKLGKGNSRSSTLEALRRGYRSIDTAFIYGGETTETQVGLAIQDAVDEKVLSSRQDVFLTSKHWRKYHGYEETMKCLNLSLKRLKMDYIDLWLIHWPGPAYSTMARRKDVLEEKGPWHYATTLEHDMPQLRSETWRAMEDAVKEGKLKAIGVSNFSIEHLKELKKTAKIWPPAVNQIEVHPLYRQEELIEYCQNEGIVVQAYASLGGQDTGKQFWKLVYPRTSSSKNAHVTTKLWNSPPVIKLANQLDKTPPQVLLRWGLENACAVIPKSATPERMTENSELFDFRLSAKAIHDLESDLDVAVAAAEEKQKEQKAEGSNAGPAFSRRLCWKNDPLRMLDFS